jgi:urease accessory protein
MNDASSNLILLDWYTAGRMARGECWEFSKYHSSNRIFLGDKQVFCDTVNLSDTPLLSVKKAMGSFMVFAMLVILGPKLADFTKTLVYTIGKANSYGAKYSCTKFITVSPLEYEDHKGHVTKGCVIRVATPSTTQAWCEIDNILSPLYGVLGGYPFENKY